MTFHKKTIRDVPIAGKTVLVRVDYNVPLKSDGKIDDDFRITASLPTLQYLIENGCKLVLISHLGRPEGKPDPRYSLGLIAQHLAILLRREVRFCDATIGDKAYQAVKTAPPRSVTVLENLRFDAREEANDPEFAKELARVSNAEYFVQDGFGALHRAHASTHAITMFLPSIAGLLVERESVALAGSLSNPKRPLVAVMGGAKVHDKIGVLRRLIDESDRILIGGMMANTFLAYRGKKVGASQAEHDQNETLDEIYQQVAKKVGDDSVEDFLVLPGDLAVGQADDSAQERRVVAVDDLGQNDVALDIGDKTIDHFCEIVSGAGTVLWNGPLGYSENPAFAHGSARLALTLATHPETVSVIGGGDTADFIRKWDVSGGKSFSHVSTGGGAGLELIANGSLPGIESLLDAHR